MAVADQIKAAKAAQSEESEEPTEASAPAAPAEAPSAAEEANDTAVLKNRFDTMKAVFAKQRKVRVRVDERVVVAVNGYQFHLPAKEFVDVPEQIAQMLYDAGLA